MVKQELNLNEKIVHVRNFTFGEKSKNYPYPMIREVDFKEFVEKIGEELDLI